ncbi:DUF3189 family protein [Falsibacillus albus]|uniref:DUF3189 family protein n=1 Tax=Falsibacillus albus TaxID=2478915 RepID=A0A3L7JXS4_9BACI|nr:DUF3189 family protein [Falsibacillus albus]RLQ93232.1 DUF3189 family protein [Falsibacillus albus]
MIYIYNDFGGTHTTSLAAAYHLNKLPKDGKLTKEEILHTPYFNKLQPKDAGRIIFHGEDEDGNPVYTIGRRRDKLLVPALKDYSLLMMDRFNAREKIVFSNTSPTVPLPMTLGGLFSRELKLDFIGVPLLVMGAKQCCHDVLRLVEHTKEMGRTTKNRITILENKEFK